MLDFGGLNVAAILQLIIGGGIVQAIVLYVKSRQEARKLGQEARKTGGEADKQSLENMEFLMGKLRAELDQEIAGRSAADSKLTEQASEIKKLVRRITRLETEVATLKARNEILEAERASRS